MSDAMVDLVRSGFRDGLVAGVVALVAVAALAIVLRPDPPVGLAGSAAAVAAIVAFGARSLPEELLAGVAALLIAPLIAHLASSGFGVRAVSVVPGAALVALGTRPVEMDWLRVVAPVAVVVVSLLLMDFDRANTASRLAPVLLGGSALGLYATVPETGRAVVLVGVLLPLAVLAWPFRTGALGAAGAGAVTGLFVWVAALGAGTRPAAAVGALASLGVLLVEPVVRHAVGLTPATRPFAPRALATVALHAGVVVIGGRVAGTQSSVSAAVVIAGGALLVCALAVIVINRPRPR
ncbi:MAG: hypothetical protein ACT4PI_02575 [Actinomycetota bacterium]